MLGLRDGKTHGAYPAASKGFGVGSGRWRSSFQVGSSEPDIDASGSSFRGIGFDDERRDGGE